MDETIEIHLSKWLIIVINICSHLIMIIFIYFC